MGSESLSEIIQRVASSLIEKSSFSETLVGRSDDKILDEIYSDQFGKFSEDFGSFGLEIDKIRSTVLPISTIKSVEKSVSALESSGLKSDQENKESTKIRFEEHIIESYENAFLRMMGMPNEKMFLGKELSQISSGKFSKFLEGDSSGRSIYSIFSERDASSTDRILSKRSEAMVFLSSRERSRSYFSEALDAEVQKSIDKSKDAKKKKEESLKDNESLDEEKLRFFFLKDLSQRPNFSNYVDATAEEISFGEQADITLNKIFRSEVMGEKSPQKNLLNYSDFILDEASLLFPPIQDSRVEYCLSESEKIISKPFDIGSLTVNRKEVGRSLLESVIRVRLDSIVGAKEENDTVGIVLAEEAAQEVVGVSDPSENEDAYSIIEEIIIDRLYVSLINLSDSFFELTQNYYKVCRKARKTLSEIISVEDHNRTEAYFDEDEVNSDLNDEEKTLKLLSNIDKTIVLMLEKSRTSTREFGSFNTSSIQDGAAMNTLLKVITIPSTYANKKLSKYKFATNTLANGSNGVIDTSVKLSHIAGLKRGVGVIDLICFGLAFFTLETKHLIGLLEKKQIKRMKKELGIRGELEISEPEEAMMKFSERLMESYEIFSASLKD